MFKVNNKDTRTKSRMACLFGVTNIANSKSLLSITLNGKFITISRIWHSINNIILTRSPEVFCKKFVLRNFAKFT